MSFLDVNIDKLIPHRPPMQLVDEVLCMHENQLWALVHIRDETLFCETDGVPSSTGLEYLGQAAAAFFTLRAMLEEQAGSQRPGMLISSRSYKARVPFFTVGENLLVHIALDDRYRDINTKNLIKIKGEIAVVKDREIDCALRSLRKESLLPIDIDAMQELWPDEIIIGADLSIYLENTAPFDDTGSTK